MERHDTHGQHRTVDTSNLRLLNRMDDFKVAKGYPDPRGWDVIARDGKRIGEVDHLLVDPGARMVRFLGVDLDRSLLTGRTRGDHVLIPVETARLSDDNRDRVLIPESSTDIGALAVYDHDNIRHLHSESGSEPGREGGARRMTLSEEELAVGKRKVAAGEVGIEKKVTTEHVRETVPATREEVTIERRPATGMSTEPRIHNDEIHIPLSREEIVVEKRTVPKEELIVKKHEVSGEERIDETVRKERAEVHGREHIKEAGRRPN